MPSFIVRPQEFRWCADDGWPIARVAARIVDLTADRRIGDVGAVPGYQEVDPADDGDGDVEGIDDRFLWHRTLIDQSLGQSLGDLGHVEDRESLDHLEAVRGCQCITAAGLLDDDLRDEQLIV